MQQPSSGDISQLLRAWRSGDQSAFDQLLPLVYQELHVRAQRYMPRERSGPTLQTTALIIEVYLRLVDLPQRNWENRAHFLAVCAQLMRRVLVGCGRARNYQKGGGGGGGQP